ncbi:MAG: PepSY domain-containing protein [Planctomycetaceae bacterium]|nr:PepSY domain-containing protein [Planctomycetaceae bacterium]
MPDKLAHQPRFHLKRVIWRWHFLVGLFISPVLVLASLTGAIYVFKPDLEPWLYPELLVVEPHEQQGSLDLQSEAVVNYAGSDWKIINIDVERQPTYPLGFVIENASYQVRTIFVDPNTNSVLGELGPANFFGVVLQIHQSLLAGTVGRLFVELTTCWCVFLVVTGIYLWWPSTWKKVKGVWLPRVRKAKPYVLLRDLHSILGAVLSPAIVMILVSGLLFAFVWGTAYHTVAFLSGAYAVRFDPPKSVPVAADSARISVDQVWEIAKAKVAFEHATIHLPTHDRDSFRVELGSSMGPSASDVVVVDQYSGDLLMQKTVGELPLMAQLTSWGYPLHVGSFLGMTTKLIWAVSSVFLACLPITGIAMWLVRRRKGSSGFPTKMIGPTPRWLVGLLLLLGLLLPTVGLTMVLVVIVEWLLVRRLPAA